MPEPIVAGLPNEEEFACPGDGLFPDPNSGCKAYFNCQGSQVIILIIFVSKSNNIY